MITKGYETVYVMNARHGLLTYYGILKQPACGGRNLGRDARLLLKRCGSSASQNLQGHDSMVCVARTEGANKKRGLDRQNSGECSSA
jgi:hypothetical protein